MTSIVKLQFGIIDLRKLNLNIACTSTSALFYCAAKTWTSSPYPCWCGIVHDLGLGCDRILLSVLAFCHFHSSTFKALYNLFVDEQSCAAAVEHVGTIGFAAMVLVQFLYASKYVVVGFQLRDPVMRECGCKVLFSLSSGIPWFIDHWRLDFSIINCLCFHSRLWWLIEIWLVFCGRCD